MAITKQSNSTIGDNIRRISKEKTLSVYRISKDSKVSQAYLSDIINNKRKNPSIEILRKIALVLKVTVEDLIN